MQTHRFAVGIGLAVLLALAPTPAWAGGPVVQVPPPNGTDDTAHLQAALNSCVAQGPHCTVQLAEGRYLTRQLVAYNFRGDLRGRGRDDTTIEALPNLRVDFLRLVVDGLPVLWLPDPTEHPWPSLILFVDGDIRVSDLSVQIPAVPSTAPYDTGFGFQFAVLIDAIRFMGQHTTHATVQRVAIDGREDPGATGFMGFNVGNGVTYVGELPTGSDIPFDYHRITGRLFVSASSFRRVAAGVYPGIVNDGRVIVGGSTSAGNVFENVAIGMDMESLENSVVEVSHNRVSGATMAGAWAVPWPFGYLPTRPSLFSLHDNTFEPAGPSAAGILLADDAAHPWIRALIFNNTIDAQDIGTNGAVSVYNTKHTTVWSNTLSGSGGHGIGVWNGAYGTLIGNDLADFTNAPELAQIVLGEATTRTTVVCKTPSDTVLDQGTSNRLIGCQEVPVH